MNMSGELGLRVRFEAEAIPDTMTLGKGTLVLPVHPVEVETMPVTFSTIPDGDAGIAALFRFRVIDVGVGLDHVPAFSEFDPWQLR